MEKQLPKNWINIKFESIGEATDFVANGSFQSLSENVIQKEEPDYAILVRLKDFSSKWKGNFRYVTKESYEFLAKSSLIEGDLFIANVGYPGKLFLVPDLGQPMTIGPNGLRVRANSISSNKFLKYYYLSPQGKEEINKIVSGTAQQKFNKTGFRQSIIPLPPLTEQNRIIEKLDRLFTQLEIIKTSMANIPLLLKDFRQQVLTQAVTGKLTGCKVEIKRLGDLLTDVKYGTSMKSEHGIDGTPIFRIPNINDGEINDTDLKYSILEDKEYNQLKLVLGDVLIIRSNGSVSLVGRSAIIRKKHEDFAYAGYLIRLRCGEELKPDFLNYTLKSSFLREQIVKTSHSSSGVNNINSQEIKDLKIYWTSPKKQQEIVSRLESLFAKADAIEQQYKTLKQKIDTLPQAFLHKAFKGELSKQLDSDGNARELLQVIKELKGATTKVAKNTKQEKLKEFNRKLRGGYKVIDEKLGMVAEPK
ncbi:MAG: hypothetical protein C0412_15285 [Flavobacterium sp.]|nr:hypothetical protein [Flavobacterium sp.]